MLTSTADSECASLHAVLCYMVSELQDNSAVKNESMPSNGNWRTRQVLRELKKLKSTSEVFASEEQLRGVVDSQETRSRVKILRGYLHEHYLTEERSLVWEEERRCRFALESTAESLLTCIIASSSLIGREMYKRSLILKDFWKTRCTIWNARNVYYITARESIFRQGNIEMELFNRKEIQHRRFLSVGREIDMELLRQQSYRVTLWACTSASTLLRDTAMLSAEEERDRCALEKLYLLKLSLIANDQENAVARLVVTSVMRASLMRRRLKNDDKQRVFAERMLMLPIKEENIRSIIERFEMEQRQSLRVDFFLSWRAVFKSLPPPIEGVALLEHLENYERLCLSDQWRYGLNALDERHYMEWRIINQRDEIFDNFYHTVSNTLTQFWRHENAEYTGIQKQYDDFLWSQRILESAVVLLAEEGYLRQRIVEAECRAAAGIWEGRLVHDSFVDVQRDINHLIVMEWEDRMCLVELFDAGIRDSLLERMFEEEELRRRCVESAASDAWVSLFSSECAARGVTLALVSARAEEERQVLAVSQWRRQHAAHLTRTFELEERSGRARVLTEEWRERFSVYAMILALVEGWNRHVVHTEWRRGLADIAVCSLLHGEETARARLESCEVTRRDFLCDSFHTVYYRLRACEVDELAGRLDIINEAELTIRATAYTRGIDRHVSYCSDELRMSQATMRFMSSEELLKQYEVDLIRILEPLARQRMTECEVYERSVMILIFEEFNGRHRLEKNASLAMDNLHALFDRLISRADQWRMRGAVQEPPSLSEPDDLFRYLRQQEASITNRLRIKREATRQRLRVFFEEFYWDRDNVVLREILAREGLMNAFYQRHLPLYSIDATPVRILLRFYNLVLLSNGELKPLTLKVWDSRDDVGTESELRETQTVCAAGSVFHMLFPAQLTERKKSATNESLVFFFEVRDSEGVLVASASHLIRGETLHPGVTVLSIPLGGYWGKMNALLYVQ